MSNVRITDISDKVYRSTFGSNIDPLYSDRFLIYIDTISMGLPTLYFKGSYKESF